MFFFFLCVFIYYMFVSFMLLCCSVVFNCVLNVATSCHIASVAGSLYGGGFGDLSMFRSAASRRLRRTFLPARRCFGFCVGGIFVRRSSCIIAWRRWYSSMVRRLGPAFVGMLAVGTLCCFGPGAVLCGRIAM